MPSINWDAVRNSIRSKLDEPRCPACQYVGGWDGGTALVTLDVLFHESQNGKPDDPEAERSVLAIPLNCPRCGYMMLLDIHALMGEHDASG